MLKKYLIGIIGALVVGVAAALLWTNYQAHNMNSAAAQTTNQEAPDITVVALADGSTVKLSDLRGKPVFLNFWATWCPPCVAEMPHMNSVYPEYKDKVNFFVVSVDDAQKEAAAFSQEKNFSYPLYFGNKGEIVQKYSIKGIPASYLIDKDGTIVKTHIGGMTQNELRAFLDSAQ